MTVVLASAPSTAVQPAAECALVESFRGVLITKIDGQAIWSVESHGYVITNYGRRLFYSSKLIAIYSANFDSNPAISRYVGSAPYVIVTECVPGSGDDIIVQPAGAVLQLSRIVDDAENPTGSTGTPLIRSNITILAYGATLERIGSQNFRLFAVGPTGHLTLRRAYVRGFRAQGGNGDNGGGGGLGAGGAMYGPR